MHKPFTIEKPRYRPLRMAERIKEELSSLIPGELKDPRLFDVQMLTITSVTLTPDLRYGTVLFALMGEPERAEQVQKGLNQAAGFLRKELMKRLNTKTTPHLSFKYDKGLDSSAEVEALLKTVPEPQS